MMALRNFTTLKIFLKFGKLSRSFHIFVCLLGEKFLIFASHSCSRPTRFRTIEEYEHCLLNEIEYLSNRPHFLWVYRRDNPRGMLGEHEKSGADGFLLTSPSQKLKKKPVGSIVHVFDSVCIKGRHSFQSGMFKKYLHSCVKNDSANKFNNTTS